MTRFRRKSAAPDPVRIIPVRHCVSGVSSHIRVLRRIEAVALDFARLGDEGERHGVALLDYALDGVYLFASHHADQHFVFLPRIVAYASHYRDAAVHFAGDVFGYLVVLVRDDVEHQRGLEARLQHVRHLRGGELGEEGVDHGGEHRGDDGGGFLVEVFSYQAERAGGNDYYAVAHEDEPLNV